MSLPCMQMRHIVNAGLFAVALASASPANAQIFTSYGEPCPRDDERNKALLVAAREYDTGWQTLENVEDDVRALSRVLDPYFGVPDILLNPPLETFVARLANLFECATSDDRLLLYYAGHGFSRQRVRGHASERTDAYLVAKDTPLLHFAVGREQGQSGGAIGPLDGTAVSVSRLLDQALQSRAKDVLIVFDACQVASPLIGVDLKQQSKGFKQKHCEDFLSTTGELADASPAMRRVWGAALSTMPTRNIITSGFAMETVTAKSAFAEAFRNGLGGSADERRPPHIAPRPSDGDGEVDTNELVRFIQAELANLGYRQNPQLACGTPKLFAF